MGVQTRYGHMSGLNVMAGQHVRKGDVIGYVGSTGRSTGPHVHYEVRINGRAVNPISNDLGR
jgi:murein DD-endopeptidase MepM/ murein hydrolase activator NlpD